MKRFNILFRYTFLASITVLLLTSCPSLQNFPKGKVRLIYTIKADNTSIPIQDSYFASKNYLIYYFDNSVTAFDPEAKQTAWSSSYYDRLIVPEYREVDNTIYIWPFGTSKTNDQPVITVLDAATGEIRNELVLNVPSELIERWNPKAIARIGKLIYIDLKRGEIAVLEENNNMVNYLSTIRVDDIYNVSALSDEPDSFRALKIQASSNESDLLILFTHADGFSGINHIYRLNVDGTTLWGAAKYIQPRDFLILNDQIVYFTPTGAVFVDSENGTGVKWVKVPAGECKNDPYILHPVEYDAENQLVYAPLGVLDVSEENPSWLWDVLSLFDKIKFSECSYKPAVKNGVAYYGTNGLLIAIDIATGEVLDVETSSAMRREYSLNAPTFNIGPYIVMPYQDYWRVMIAVYLPDF